MTEPTTPPELGSHLSPAQLARVEALTASRHVQVRSTGLAKASGPDALDLVAVARFILDGVDPWPEAATDNNALRAATLREAAVAIREDSWPDEHVAGAMEAATELVDRAAQIERGE